VTNPATIKFKLVIAYDGGAYEGWQVQKVGTGVQEIIERAFAKIFSTPLRLHSSSRTDTGVHALGMVAHVEILASEFRMEERKLILAINAHLPEDIRIMSVTRVSAKFHARFDARGKEYRYFIWNLPSMNPLLRKTAWHVPLSLDLAAMKKASERFVGNYDFRSFAANRNYVTEDTVRTLTRCSITRKGPLLTIVIRGDGFLYKMCRGIVGTLVQIGQGKIQVTEMDAIFESKARKSAGMTAPAHGLVLWKVFY